MLAKEMPKAIARPVRLALTCGWLILSCFSTASLADTEKTAPALRFSGFGTLGAAWFSSHDADYTTSQPDGPGRTRRTAYNLDSLLAGQLDWQITPTLAASLQAIAMERPNGHWTPFVRLANLRYAVNDDTHVRAGLLPNLTMLASEYRWVNFGNPWPRLPTEVYRLFGQNDAINYGADLSVVTRHDFGRLDWNLSAVATHAHAARSNANGVDEIISRAITATLTWERGNWKSKLTLMPWGEFTSDPQQTRLLRATLSQLDPANAKYFDDRGTQKTLGFSLAYDSNDWLMIGEIVARRYQSSTYREPSAGYLTVGHHFGNALPYVTLARLRSSIPHNGPNANPASAATLTAFYRGQQNSQSSLALGMAYDVSPGVQIKTQLDFIRPDAGSNGLLFNHAPTYNRASPPVERLFSLSVDFVF